MREREKERENSKGNFDALQGLKSNGNFSISSDVAFKNSLVFRRLRKISNSDSKLCYICPSFYLSP